MGPTRVTAAVPTPSHPLHIFLIVQAGQMAMAHGIVKNLSAITAKNKACFAGGQPR
jgi:hypothetical protein